VVDSTICDCCYCSGVHVLDIYVSCTVPHCDIQCGMLLVATMFDLHNKLLLYQVNCTVY